MILRPLPVVAVGAIILVAVLAPLFPLPSPVAMDVAHRLVGPTSVHWLGRDEFGRDVLSRLLFGARVSLSVAFSSAALACIGGIVLGLVGGFQGKLAEILAVRSVDIVLCFPPLLLALLVVTLLGPGATTLVPVLTIVYLPGFVRVVHAGVLQVRGHEYVEAMRALGASRPRIMLRTILPNIVGPILVQFSLAAASGVVLESGLSFLGLGVVPPAPSWGLMIGAARATMTQAPLLLLWPCLALTVTILAMNALCDALRDAFDPHAVRRRLRRRITDLLAPGLLPAAEAALTVRDLTIEIETPAGAIRPVRGVSLQARSGETVAIVGESGSGKSLTGLAIMGLLPQAARVVVGAAWVDEAETLHLAEPALARLRGSRMAMIFQDPLSSLNPVHRIGAQITEAIRAHRAVPNAWSEAVGLLRRVGIPDPERRAFSYPYELSGGMRQRAMIAMAIANNPRVLIADEPTTALDVTIQAQVLELLADLRSERGMAVVLITHSLPVVAETADRVVVMYAGEVVEQGHAGDVFARPLHPYTASLLRSAPRADGSLPEPIPGVVPLPHELPQGCVFAPRCAHAAPECLAARPALTEPIEGRATRCIRWHMFARVPEVAT
jgi:oligopeptide/dipeptide ABC transporter ATP-binding protein